MTGSENVNNKNMTENTKANPQTLPLLNMQDKIVNMQDKIGDKLDTKESSDIKKPQSFGDTLKEASSFVPVTRQENSKNTSQNKSDSNMFAFNSFQQTAQAQNTNQVQGIKGEAQAPYVQVGRALESAVKSNVTKLEVQLNPVELGALTVMLTSKAGEITAIIQPEKAETAQVINQQMQALRNELEHQGIKLERIEVQLKSSDSQEFANSQDQQFSGNQGQAKQDEYTARTHELTRLRNIGRSIQENDLDPDVLSEEDLVLAQTLQSEAYLSDSTSAGLHIQA